MHALHRCSAPMGAAPTRQPSRRSRRTGHTGGGEKPHWPVSEGIHHCQNIDSGSMGMSLQLQAAVRGPGRPSPSGRRHVLVVTAAKKTNDRWA